VENKLGLFWEGIQKCSIELRKTSAGLTVLIRQCVCVCVCVCVWVVCSLSAGREQGWRQQWQMQREQRGITKVKDYLHMAFLTRKERKKGGGVRRAPKQHSFLKWGLINTERLQKTITGPKSQAPLSLSVSLLFSCLLPRRRLPAYWLVVFLTFDSSSSETGGLEERLQEAGSVAPAALFPYHTHKHTHTRTLFFSKGPCVVICASAARPFFVHSEPAELICRHHRN